MSVILNKEKIQISEVICQKYHRTAVECDVIVPDIKPDIKQILELDGYVSVSEKIIRNGKVYIKGTVCMTVLYVPDGDVPSKVKNLTASQEFNCTIDAVGADIDSSLSVEAEPEFFNFSLINSRKVNLRCNVGINIKLTGITEKELPVSVADSTVCTLTSPLTLCTSAITSENRIVICKQLELPSGKPGIGEILKTTIFPQSDEFCFTSDRASAKGRVKICTLYTSADDGSFQFAEHTVSFDEILDVTGAEEDMEGEIEYTLSDLYCELRDDTDGEPRLIGIEAGLCASIRGYKIKQPSAITDAYSTDGECALKIDTCTIEQLIDNTTAQLTHKPSVHVPEILPEIKQICDVSTNASVERISVGDDEITVFGNMKCTILFISNDKDMPLGSFSDTSEFSYTFPAPGCSTSTICDAKVYTEHVSYTLGGDAIELRVVLGLSLRTFRNDSFTYVTDISITPEVPCRKPYITIYFVQKGDSLWSIAKKYRTTVEALTEYNNLKTDVIHPGQQLRICR